MKKQKSFGNTLQFGTKDYSVSASAGQHTSICNGILRIFTASSGDDSGNPRCLVVLIVKHGRRGKLVNIIESMRPCCGWSSIAFEGRCSFLANLDPCCAQLTNSKVMQAV